MGAIKHAISVKTWTYWRGTWNKTGSEVLWQRKQGKNRDFVKEFSTGPSPFLGNYPTFPSGTVTRHLGFFFFILLHCRPTIYFNMFSGWICTFLGWLSHWFTSYVNLNFRGSYTSSETNLLCKETSTYLLTALKLFKPDVSKLFCKKGLNSTFNYAPWSRS